MINTTNYMKVLNKKTNRYVYSDEERLKRKRESDKKYQKKKRKRLKGYKTEEYKKYCKKYPEKVFAHRLLNRSIINGETKRGVCKVCGSKNAHGHHEDYKSPLDVIWLCPVHHKLIHLKTKKK